MNKVDNKLKYAPSDYDLANQLPLFTPVSSQQDQNQAVQPRTPWTL